MSSRSTQGGQQTALEVAKGAASDLALAVGVVAFGAPRARRVEPRSQDSFKTEARVEAEFASCPGPAGLWPCALSFGHGGDHVPTNRPGSIQAELLRVTAERDEMASCLRVAMPLLKDWPFERGASLRRSLIARIGKAVR